MRTSKRSKTKLRRVAGREEVVCEGGCTSACCWHVKGAPPPRNPSSVRAVLLWVARAGQQSNVMDANVNDNSRVSLLMVPASRSELTWAIGIGANGDDARRSRAALIPDWRSFSF